MKGKFKAGHIIRSKHFVIVLSGYEEMEIIDRNYSLYTDIFQEPLGDIVQEPEPSEQ